MKAAVKAAALITSVPLPTTEASRGESRRLTRRELRAKRKAVMAEREAAITAIKARFSARHQRSVQGINALDCGHYCEHRAGVGRPPTEQEARARLSGLMRAHTLQEFISSGGSILVGACNCYECRSARAVWWTGVHVSGEERDAAIAEELAEWDERNNPFSPLYRDRPAARRARRTRLAPTGGPLEPSDYSDKSARGACARLVGLEVEHNVNNTPTIEWAERWEGASVIRDGSCGYEAVTPPLAGANIPECLFDLCSALSAGRAGADARCGLHVHVDARDLGWTEMLRLLTIWCRIEGVMFLIAGQHRYTVTGTHYCTPCAPLFYRALRTADPKGSVLSAALLYTYSNPKLNPATSGRAYMREQAPGKKHEGRYKALNIAPWIAGRALKRPDTTVEFRLHHGTHNYERILNWTNICQDIVHFATTATNADVEALPGSAARALTIISPRSKDWIIKRLLGWRKATTVGNPYANDVGSITPRRIIGVRGGTYVLREGVTSYGSR